MSVGRENHGAFRWVRARSVVAVGCVALIATAGCGDDDDDAEPAATAAEATGAPAPETTAPETTAADTTPDGTGADTTDGDGSAPG